MGVGDMHLSVTLTMWGDKLVPEEVSGIAGMEPHNSERKGDYRRDRIAKIGRWSLRTDEIMDSRHLSEHLRSVVDRFGDKMSVLRERQLVDQARLSIMVHVEDEDKSVSSWEDEIDASTLSEVARLGASLSLTFLWPIRDDPAKR
jgi:hypothetical protein